MTRFARAKGSKSSNERIPEESTSWRIMKQQLLEKTNNSKMEIDKKEVNKQKIANYKNFLKEKEEEESKHTVWASFPVQRNKSLLLSNKSKKSLKAKIVMNDVGQTHTPKIKTKNIEKKLKLVLDIEQKTKDSIYEMNKKSKKIRKTDESNDKTNMEQENRIKINDVTKTKKKRNKQIKAENLGDSVSVGIRKQNLSDQSKIKSCKNKKKKVKQKKSEESGAEVTKKNAKDLKKHKNELTESDLQKIEKKKEKKVKQLLKKKQFKEKLKEQNSKHQDVNLTGPRDSKGNEGVTNESSTTKITSEVTEIETKEENNRKKIQKKQNAPLKNKKKKICDGEPQRRKPTLPCKMFINGKELEISYVEGFPVKKEDADRLKKLRKELISKGLPRSQIDTALKLERRRAEKALAREKKKVCFNCRKSGHNLSDCPELEKNELVETTGSGICFKCGSAEHTHFECKVVRGQDYKFAQCFICNEQGHIARQCPDNARGLYPKGGACRVCGDVTHLKKDCPRYQAQQEKQENNFKLHTLGNSNPEMLDDLDDTSESRNFKPAKTENKIIKFV